MKKKMFVLVALLVALALTTTGASAAPEPQTCPFCEVDMTQYHGPLTEAEVEGLLQALNDEYYAYAVYDQVVTDFGMVRNFVNIRRAETSHANAIITLLNRYSVSVPANPWVGHVPSFAALGQACSAGAAEEARQGPFYDALETTTTRADILNVYNQLEWASLNRHLPVFQRCAR